MNASNTTYGIYSEVKGVGTSGDAYAGYFKALKYNAVQPTNMYGLYVKAEQGDNTYGIYVDADAGCGLYVADGMTHLSEFLSQEGGATFNASGVDVDFTISSDDKTRMFFVNGNTNQVSINSYSTSAPVVGDTDRDFKHDSPFTVRGDDLGTADGDTTGLITLGHENGNSSYLEIFGVRDTAGSTWQSSGLRIQHVTDATGQGYIEFNGEAGDYGLALGTGVGSSAYQNQIGLKIDRYGHVTKPLQPAFHAFQNNIDSNISQNTNHTVIFNAERFDQNSDYNTTTGVFTAPVTGKYLFGATLRMGNIPTVTWYIWLKFVSSNRTYWHALQRISQMDLSAEWDYWMAEGTSLIDMDANDTCKVQVYIAYAGANTVDIQGYSTTSDMQTKFWGYLAA